MINKPDKNELAEIDNPEWEKYKHDRVHNWRNHVLEEHKELWNELSLETRTAIYFMAEEQAGDEHWE